MPTEKGVEQYFPNKAFERYFQIESDDLRDIYKDAVRKNEEKGKVINFKK